MKKLIVITIAVISIAIVVIVLLVLNRKIVFSPEVNEIVSIPKIVDTQVSYIFTADSGFGGDTQKAVGSNISKYCKINHCESMFIAGDIIYPAGVTSTEDISFLEKFETPYKDVDLPIYIAFGNHDLLGCSTCYFEYSKLSTKWKMPSEYYSIKDNNIEFFIINTENYNEIQDKWLKDSLENSTSKYKIVVGHRPVLTYELTHNNEDWPLKAQDRVKMTICNTADVFVSGHSHLLEDVGKIEGCKFRQLNAGGGGDPVDRPLVGSDGNKSIFQSQDNGYLVLKEENTKLNFSFMNLENNIIYTVDSI